MATVTIDYYGMTGTGRNVTEAKRDAGHKLERLARNSRPSIFRHRGHVLIVWNDAEGLGYSISHPDSDDGPVCSTSYSSDANGMEYAVRHLLTFDRKIGEFDIPLWAKRFIDVKSLLEDWRRSDQFNRAYRHAENLPADELPRGGVHQWACDHMGEAQFAE